MNNGDILKKFITKVLIIIIIMLTVIFTFAILSEGEKEKATQPEKPMVKNKTTSYNFDGKYKNKYGAVIEIKGNQALIYASADDSEMSIEDDFIESTISSDGKTKTLRYRYIDNTGGYTIIVCGKKLKVTYEKPEENDLIACQYTKI